MAVPEEIHAPKLYNLSRLTNVLNALALGAIGVVHIMMGKVTEAGGLETLRDVVMVSKLGSRRFKREKLALYFGDMLCSIPYQVFFLLSWVFIHSYSASILSCLDSFYLCLTFQSRASVVDSTLR